LEGGHKSGGGDHPPVMREIRSAWEPLPRAIGGRFGGFGEYAAREREKKVHEVSYFLDP